jgi:DNA-directed RNA polymerase subunit RPC12/RpoP
MAIPVSFPCPACNGKLRASARFAGRATACPRCGKRIIVPPQAPTEEAPVLVMDDGHRTERASYRYS